MSDFTSFVKQLDKGTLTALVYLANFAAIVALIVGVEAVSKLRRWYQSRRAPSGDGGGV